VRKGHIASVKSFVQDPIIFAGSVRVNLDPYGDASTDADMWAALKQAGLKQMVQSLPVRPANWRHLPAARSGCDNSCH